MAGAAAVKGSHSAYWKWRDFCVLWRRCAAAMRDPWQYQASVRRREQHLARAAEAAAGWQCGDVGGLLTYVEWELVECMDSLNPEPQIRGESDNAFHAGCCALRASAAVHRLRKLLEVQ